MKFRNLPGMQDAIDKVTGISNPEGRIVSPEKLVLLRDRPLPREAGLCKLEIIRRYEQGAYSLKDAYAAVIIFNVKHRATVASHTDISLIDIKTIKDSSGALLFSEETLKQLDADDPDYSPPSITLEAVSSSAARNRE